MKKLITFIFLFLLTLPLAKTFAAEPLEATLILNNSSATYKVSEKFKLELELKNNTNSTKNYIVTYVLTNKDQNFLPLKLPINISVEANKVKKITLVDTIIDNTFVNGEYLISSNIVENNQLLKALSKNFKVTDLITKTNIDFDFYTCTDSSCAIKSNVFIKGSQGYFKTQDSLDQIKYLAKYTDPKNQEITLDLLKPLKFELVGNYKFTITATKDGFLDTTKTYSIGVLDQAVEIIAESECNNNLTCDSNETPQNCPQDCSVFATDNNLTVNTNPYYFPLIIIIGILTTGIVLLLIYKKNY